MSNIYVVAKEVIVAGKFYKWWTSFLRSQEGFALLSIFQVEVFYLFLIITVIKTKNIHQFNYITFQIHMQP